MAQVIQESEQSLGRIYNLGQAYADSMKFPWISGEVIVFTIYDYRSKSRVFTICNTALGHMINKYAIGIDRNMLEKWPSETLQCGHDICTSSIGEI